MSLLEVNKLVTEFDTDEGIVRALDEEGNLSRLKESPRFTLTTAWWIEGRVLDLRGNPVEGIAVNAALTGKKFSFPESVHFHGIGDHGGGPARHNLDALQRFQSTPLLPSANCSTLAKYTEKLLASGAEIPEAQGESDFTFEGCYTTHADIKRENRAGENLLSSADTLTVLAGIDKRDQLSQAWRTRFWRSPSFRSTLVWARL